MLGAIWSGAGTASDVCLLIGAVLAGLDALLVSFRGAPEAALLPVAVCLIAVGLLAM
jgi:hypothetical protein